jgi:hypothetical protein
MTKTVASEWATDSIRAFKLKIESLCPIRESRLTVETAR